MNNEPEALFDIASEMDSILRAQDIARRMGKNQIGLRVNEWAVKWKSDIPLPAIRELSEILKDES